jgi:hypothetical protein
MNLSATLTLVLALGGPNTLPAAVLYGNYQSTTPPAQIVGGIDTATGAITTIATVTGAIGAPPGVSAFDPLASAYYFYAWDASVTYRLYAVNVRTGAVSPSPPVTQVPSAMQFDPVTRALYGTVYTGTPNALNVIFGRLDTATGSFTPIATVVTSSLGSPLGISAIDPVTRHYYLCAGDSSGTKLFAVDIRTGAVTSSSAISTFGMQFDLITRALYGTTYTGPNRTVGVGRIDTSTGAITPVATVGDFLNPVQGVSAFDPLSRVYSFYAYPVEAAPNLYSVNVHTGTFTAAIGVPVLPIAMDSGHR